MKCARCKKEIPNEFLSPMSISGVGHMLIDPECALEIMSQIHGIPITQFTGDAAQMMLVAFQEWKGENEDG